MNVISKLAMPALALGLLATSAVAEQADVAFVNGQFLTLDPARPEAQAVAVKDGVFIAVGTGSDIAALTGEGTKVVDLHGQRVLPGLIDAHTHPLETLWMKSDWVDARYPDTPSVAEALSKIAARAASTQPGDWILVACVSASENKFAEKRLPTKAELDRIAPGNPVLLANGAHMAVVNSKALQVLGIGRGTTRLPKGGVALTDADGNPNGVITDGFADIPISPKPEEIAKYYGEGIAQFWNAHGFTSMLAITPSAAVPVLQAVSRTVQQPNIRYTVSVWGAPDGKDLPDDLSTFDMPKAADANYYRFAGIKAWVDGENDARTGYMDEPYIGHFDIDPAGGRGALVTPPPEADRFVDLARRNGRLAMLHCSGDAATDICLTAYEKDAAANPAAAVMRRIEHFGMFQLTGAQLQRAQALRKAGLFISVQPIWLTELVKADFENMGPERAATGFKFETLIKAGLEPAASTDMTGLYLGNIDPFKAMQALVTRMSDMGLFAPEEAVSIEDAIRMWTIWPAKAIGEDRLRGTIAVGKLADMVVLTEDILTVPADRIAEVQAAETVVGGRVVYQRP